MRIKLTLLVIFLLGSGISVSGQTGHYWTQQYGTRSMLLGGSVIGGVEDLGAVYYNPARLGFVENPAFLLSADVYQWQQIKFDDAVGENQNLSKSEFDGVPSLAAGTFGIKFLPNHKFAYAILSRNRSNLNFGYNEELDGDVFPEWEGQELFEADVKLGSSIKDTWWGVSWSHALNDKISLGSSFFISNLKNERTAALNLTAWSFQYNTLATYDFSRSFGYESYGLLAKFGAAFALENWNLGITLTTPRLNIYTNTDYNYQNYFAGIPGVTALDDLYANSYQTDMDLKLKTPFSLGGGATWLIGSSKLHFSAEYFGGIDQYELFSAESHEVQSNPDSVVNFSLIDENKPVVNMGLGAEWYISQHVSAYLSFNTDFSSVPANAVSFLKNESVISNSNLKNNNYHVAGGVVLNFKGADITIGLSRTGTKQSLPRPVSLPSESNNTDDIFDPNESAQFKWRRYILVFSFSVPFLEDYVRNKLDGGDKE